MFDFYNLFYKEGYLKIEELKEATKWNVITPVQYKEITTIDYVA